MGAFYRTENIGFQNELRSKIKDYFVENNLTKYAPKKYFLKITLLFVFWIASLILIYFQLNTFHQGIIFYLLHGFISILIVFNVGHDAAHNAISKKIWVNNTLKYCFNLLGANYYSWHLKHDIGHHKYTNIHGLDFDIETTPLFRVSQHTNLKWYYRFQHLYVFPLYCTFSLAVVLVIDFLVFFKIKNSNKPTNYKNWLFMILTKSLYFFYILYLPFYFSELSFYQIVACFLIMHCLIGFMMSIVLFPSHFVLHSTFYSKEEKEYKNNSWAEHQIKTTIDIAPQSKVMNFILGGLNTNTLHHIYPTINHTHLMQLTKILKETAQKHNLPYKEYSLFRAIKEHFIFLKTRGKK